MKRNEIGTLFGILVQFLVDYIVKYDQSIKVYCIWARCLLILYPADNLKKLLNICALLLLALSWTEYFQIVDKEIWKHSNRILHYVYAAYGGHMRKQNGTCVDDFRMKASPKSLYLQETIQTFTAESLLLIYLSASSVQKPS